MPSGNDSTSEPMNRKCGEIIITMKKNAKNVYSFNCWFCDTICIQMKKFTMHLEREHEQQLELPPSGLANTLRCEEDKTDVDTDCANIFIPEIKVEDFVAEEIKSENEQDFKDHNTASGNSRKRDEPEKFHDPLETAHRTVEEIMLPRKGEETHFGTTDPSNFKYESNEQSIVDNLKEDVDMQSFSDEDYNVKYNSDISADENTSSSEYKPDDSADEDRIRRSAKRKESRPPEKLFVSALISAFKSLPQLWDTSQSEKCSVKQKEELLQTLTDSINIQLKMKLKVYTVKKKLSSLCKEYENEIEKEIVQATNDTQKSELWYYDQMDFLKILTENKLKHKRKKPSQKVKPLSDKLLSDLTDIYKNYNSLWDVNHLAFTIKDKRHETMEIMLDEIKTKMNLTLDVYRLEKHLAQIHKSYSKEKLSKLECDNKQQSFKPTSTYYFKCEFLEMHQGPFCCPTCNEIIDSYNDYQLHKSTHDGSIPFKCQECGMGFKKISNYTIHAKRHLRVFKFHCEICGKGYPFNAELDLHMRSHTGAQPYLCSICGEGFRTAISYDNHIRRHEERFKYFCHICKKGFNHMTRLNDHVKAHLNVRDVICAVCGKGFTSRKYLNHHKRIHEGKNYNCNICGKSFAQDAGLRAHKKYHGTPIGISSMQKEQNKYNLLS